MSSAAERANKWITISVRAFSLAVVLTGLGFAAYAGVQWLQTARWQPLTVNGVFASWATTRDWVAHPRSWIGLHRILVWTLRVPVFLIITILGIALVLLTSPHEGPNTSATWSSR